MGTYVNEVTGSVRIGRHQFTGCKIGKFSINPADGGVITLTCQASIHPSAADMPDLSRAVQDQEHVAIEADPDLFDTTTSQQNHNGSNHEHHH
jgi:hypothetical protein